MDQVVLIDSELRQGAVATQRPQSLSVVLKIASRCNLNCSYCYIYNLRDQAYLSQPALLSDEGIVNVARFIAEGAAAAGVSRVQVIFHGGEPLLAGKARFERFSRCLSESLQRVSEFSLAVQTNATLIDDEWIDVFERCRVAVGVSLDGPADINDRSRFTITSQGSHSMAVAGIRQLVAARELGRISSVGLLCVIDAAQDPARLLAHFVDELKIRRLDFLFPDVTHEDGVDALSIGRYVERLHAAWIDRDDPSINIRMLSSVVSLLLGGRSKMIGFGKDKPLAITINTDGTISPDDTLRNCGHGMMESGATIYKDTLAGFLAGPLMSRIFTEGTRTPAGCRECPWEPICGGGHLVHRFSPATGFDNPSVLCDGLQLIYRRVAAHLIASGYENRVIGALGGC